MSSVEDFVVVFNVEVEVEDYGFGEVYLVVDKEVK